jgi:hypothetical protein
MKDKKPNRMALAMARRRWQKKAARLKQAENRRQYWAQFTPEQRKQKMRAVWLKSLAKRLHQGLTESTSDDD